MTINAPAAIMLAFYVVAAEENGVPADRLGGTIQADILKEYIAQKEWCFPVDPAMRLLGDMMEWSHAAHAALAPGLDLRLPHPRGRARRPRRSSRSRSRTASPTSSSSSRAGSTSTHFAPRLSFFFNAQIDFFEEIAKYRAARRIWARELRDTYGAKNPRSWLMRFHTQTAGVSLTAQQPLNNIVRTAIEALAGVLGGTQSLHTNSYDEALALPTEDAVRIALRTQQIIAHETGVTNTADPLGGSYFVEALTDRMEELAYDYFRQDRRARRHGRGGQAQLPAARDRRRGVRAAGAHRRRRAGRRRRQPLHRGRRRRDAAPAHRPRARAQADRPAAGRAGAARRRARSSDASPCCASAAGDRGATSCRRCSTARARTRPRAR